MSRTYLEICGQYDALAKTMEFLDSEKDSLIAWIRDIKPKQVIFLGCGSSFSVAKSLADAVCMRLPVFARALPAGDVLLHAGRYVHSFQGALLVSVSRSGSTSEIVRAIEALRKNGCGFALFSVSCTENSPLDKLSDRYIDLPWAFDESVCQTRTVSCLYFTGMYLIACLAGDDQMRYSLLDVVEKGPAFLRGIEDQCKKIASEDWDRVIALGDAEISGLCEEGALAFNEICQIPSNFYHLLDSRHGPMVLIKPKTLVIAALSGEGGGLETDLIKDVLAKGAAVVTVSSAPVTMEGARNFSWGAVTGNTNGGGTLTGNINDSGALKAQDNYSGPLHHAALGLAFILACQFISYYKSIHTGADPDKPDGLAPWISL